MNLQTDILIVGAGLAGACAAVHLAPSRDVMLIDAAGPAEGASGAGAGLANPFTGRRAKPVWRMEDARDALAETVELSDARSLVLDYGILRPAASADLAEKMRQVTREHRHLTCWLDAGDCRRHFPHVIAPHGALFHNDGSAINIGGFCLALVKAAEKLGADVRMRHRLVDINEHPRGATCRLKTDNGDVEVDADIVVLATGDGYPLFPYTADLNVHRVKGQTISIDGIDLPPRHPHVAGLGYLVNEGAAPDGEPGTSPRFVAGSTYEHAFADARPTEEATSHILTKVSKFVPSIIEGTVTQSRAGIRVTVPGTRMPMVGPVSTSDRVWVFTGLGAKGLMTAPLIARSLSGWLMSPSNIPTVLIPRVAAG